VCLQVERRLVPLGRRDSAVSAVLVPSKNRREPA
jgi:hypothetical protein